MSATATSLEKEVESARATKVAFIASVAAGKPLDTAEAKAAAAILNEPIQKWLEAARREGDKLARIAELETLADPGRVTAIRQQLKKLQAGVDAAVVELDAASAKVKAARAAYGAVAGKLNSTADEVNKSQRELGRLRG